MPAAVILAPGQAFTMVRHARRDAPHEAVGAIVVNGAGHTRVVELPNTHPDPTRRYAVGGLVLLDLEQAMEDAGERYLGIYHSHPGTAPLPSHTDITSWTRPDVPCIIIGLVPRVDIRAWRISDRVTEEPVLLGS